MKRTPESKILSREDCRNQFGPQRDMEVVFTNGCFDVLHPGHVAYLNEARSLADVLIVGVNSDASMQLLNKGPGRPVMSEFDRAFMVAALESVDVVCVFDDDTPAELISEIVPDVLVKGADYTLEGLVGRKIVEDAGGRVGLIPLHEDYSSTNLLIRIREAHE
ncbi:uncharacterized protein METZ01_LOCUS95154 [marine metagenome]|uniref:D-glycero-beta-D-manno-heptose 1-phosphate adenylyltransferase n=1 Tax=marine metagenome TaxID=408172 RepID=A0A381VPR8_9ZZZZ